MLKKIAPLLFALFAVAPAAGADSPNPASLKVPPEQMAKARALVRQLGSPIYRDRDRATRELAGMGRLAISALVPATLAEDAEVRDRAAWLLARAEVDDLRAKIATFLADTDGSYQHDLPGWDAFRTVAGDDKSSRALFTEVVKNPANRDLLLALRTDQANPQAGLSRALAARKQSLYLQSSQPLPNGGFVYRNVNPDLPDVAILFLAESLVSDKGQPVVAGFSYNPANFLVQQAAKEAMAEKGSGATDAAFRKVVLQWLETRENPQGIYLAMIHSQNLNLGTDLITRYANRLLNLDSVSHVYRYQAISYLARHGGRRYFPTITRMFGDDNRLLNAVNGQVEVRIRDFALATALTLTGQDPLAYGFSTQPGANESLKFSYTYHRFYSDNNQSANQKREAAFAKWRAWEAEVLGSIAGPAAVIGGQDRRYSAK